MQAGALCVPPYFPARQGAHGSVEADVPSPGSHAVQAMAPLSVNVSVTDPAAQVTQTPASSAAANWPGAHAAHSFRPCSANRPLGHEAHASVESGEERPAGQTVQAVAPPSISVSVFEPGAHMVHSDCASSAANWPREHGLQVDASAAFAYLPLAQPRHVLAPRAANLPAGHPAQASVEATEKRPQGHASHAVPPTF